MSNNNSRIDLMLRQAIEIIEKLMAIKEEAATEDRPLPDDLCNLICDLADNAYNYRTTPSEVKIPELTEPIAIPDIQGKTDPSHLSEISDVSEFSEDTDVSELSDISETSEIADELTEIEVDPNDLFNPDVIMQNLSINEIFLYGRFFGGGKSAIRNYIVESHSMTESDLEADLERRGLSIDSPEGERFYSLLVSNR